MTGLAQKGGSVYSHIRIARASRGHPRGAHRRGRGATSCSARHDRGRLRRGDRQDAGGSHARGDQRRRGAHGRLHHEPGPADPARSRWPKRSAQRRAMAPRISSTPARIATALLGRLDRDQPLHGRLRVPEGPDPGRRGLRSARPIELNGAAVESNLRAFEWGRRAAVDLASVQADRHAARGQAGVAAPVGVAGRDDRAAARVPHRLPERGLREALRRLRRARAQRGGGEGARAPPRSARPWRATSSSSWPTRTSTRSRGSTRIPTS